MKVGDSVEVTRAITAEEVEGFAALGGAPADRSLVPEPLIGGLWSYLLGVKLPGLGTMYLKQETEYRESVAVGTALTARVTITRTRPEKHLVDLETTCWDPDGRVVAEGRALVYVRDVVGARD